MRVHHPVVVARIKLRRNCAVFKLLVIGLAFDERVHPHLDGTLQVNVVINCIILELMLLDLLFQGPGLVHIVQEIHSNDGQFN